MTENPSAHPFLKTYQDQLQPAPSAWQQLTSFIETKLKLKANKHLLVASLLAIIGLISLTTSLWRLTSHQTPPPAQAEDHQLSQIEPSLAPDPTPEPTPDPSPEAPEAIPQRHSAPIVVDIGGAVVKPGVYGLPAGSRLGDAIVAAGGISATANTQLVAQVLNLASPLSDSQKIYIPFAGESAVLSWDQTAPSSPTPEPETQDPTPTPSATPDNSGKVSINTATAKQLMELSGIGESRSATIIANRPYDTLEDLVTKGSLTQKLFDDLKESLRL